MFFLVLYIAHVTKNVFQCVSKENESVSSVDVKLSLFMKVLNYDLHILTLRYITLHYMLTL